MKILILILFSLYVIQANAQEKPEAPPLRHLNIEVSTLFWSPTDPYIQKSNSLVGVIPYNHVTSYMPTLDGYGSCIAPTMHINYFFKNFLGIRTGFNYLHLLNILEYKGQTYPLTGTPDKVQNEATIINLKLGYIGQTNSKALIQLYYGIGIDFVPSYIFAMSQPKFIETPDFNAKGNTIGFYIETGMKIKIYHFVYFNLGMEYSYIPTRIKYYDSYENTNHFEVNSNLGAVAANIGLSFNFIKY